MGKDTYPNGRTLHILARLTGLAGRRERDYETERTDTNKFDYVIYEADCEKCGEPMNSYVNLDNLIKHSSTD